MMYTPSFPHTVVRSVGVCAGAFALLVACSTPPLEAPTADESTPHETTTGDEQAATPEALSEHTDDRAGDLSDDEQPAVDAVARPDWLGTRTLPLRADGFGEIQPTPDELIDRQLPPPSSQPRAPDATFVASLEPVPGDVLARSTWGDHCPVDADELALVNVTFWGFDAVTYRGELLVHTDAAEQMVEVFRELFDAEFPIEEMRIIRADELDAAPTGDGNVTTAFVCRAPVVGGGWSQHAFGLAIDINPFHNPYVRGDLIIPELASAYTDRDDFRAGMIVTGDVVTNAFAGIGWGWGGNWRTVDDPMHFSATGR